MALNPHFQQALPCSTGLLQLQSPRLPGEARGGFTLYQPVAECGQSSEMACPGVEVSRGKWVPQSRVFLVLLAGEGDLECQGVTSDRGPVGVAAAQPRHLLSIPSEKTFTF